MTSEGYFVKDLRILSRDLKEVIFIAITDFILFPNKKEYFSIKDTLIQENPRSPQLVRKIIQEKPRTSQIPIKK